MHLGRRDEIVTNENWLFAELRRAAEESRKMPDWARPVVTAPYSASREAPEIGGTLDTKPSD